MIILNKSNCKLQIVEKKADSPTAAKSTFYPDFKVCLVLEGEAVWEIEGQTYHVHPGDIIFLNIGQRRQFISFGENGFKLCAFVLKRNAFYKPHHLLFFLNRIKNCGSVIRKSDLSELVWEAYDAWRKETPLQYEMASLKLTEFFIKARMEQKDTPEAVSPRDMQMLQIMDYIDERVTCGISLCEAAKHAGMSQSGFSRKFSEWNGVSFKQYVVEKKIRHAMHLLETSNMKMIDVALESGFESVSGFYDAFKKKTGTTPGRLTDWDV